MPLAPAGQLQLASGGERDDLGGSHALDVHRVGYGGFRVGAVLAVVASHQQAPTDVQAAMYDASQGTAEDVGRCRARPCVRAA
jgi:hypothetical protein